MQLPQGDPAGHRKRRQTAGGFLQGSSCGCRSSRCNLGVVHQTSRHRRAVGESRTPTVLPSPSPSPESESESLHFRRSLRHGGIWRGTVRLASRCIGRPPVVEFGRGPVGHTGAGVAPRLRRRPADGHGVLLMKRAVRQASFALAAGGVMRLRAALRPKRRACPLASAVPSRRSRPARRALVGRCWRVTRSTGSSAGTCGRWCSRPRRSPPGAGRGRPQDAGRAHGGRLQQHQPDRRDRFLHRQGTRPGRRRAFHGRGHPVLLARARAVCANFVDTGR